jgi:translation initiation factor IF-2
LAKRIFEIAKELGVRSKDVLEKCKAEDLDVKNHMASVSAGLEETIRDWFSAEGSEHTAVETAEHVDIEAAKAAAEKERKRRAKKKEQEQADAPQEPPAEGDESQDAPAEEAPVPAEEEAPAEELQPAAEEPAQAVAEADPPEPDQPEEQPAEQPQAQEPEPEEKDEDVKPAGPQVVPAPAQLKGPRVVRVEKPDYIPRPQPRQVQVDQGPPQLGGGTHQRKAGESEDEAKKRTRRSPRRKGRSGVAEAGEKLREWRRRDLDERNQRIHGGGATLRRSRGSTRGKGGARQSASGVKSGQVEIAEPLTIKNISATTGVKSGEIIKKLMTQGMMATINEVIPAETAEAIMAEYDIELVIARDKTAEEQLMETLAERPEGEKTPRPPVVTFLGHVDHGKTSLLDHIRKTTVANGEAGGITQAIGAYRHDFGEQHVVFLDTPGHEAFTAMRARGANMTDVVVLVVAADDGVMPQTIEAINHAKAAEVPIVVALNKIDVPNANINRALGQLAEHDLQPQEWGGNTEVIHTSAQTGEGIDELVELLSLEAEVLELTGEYDAPASGYVIEARMDPGQGPLATILNLNGTLRVGDVVQAGRGFGYVRQIYNDRGQAIDEAPPATPVAITGLDEVPEAGDRFFAVEDIDTARNVAEQRRSEQRSQTLARADTAPRSLDELIGKIEAGEATELNLILKADVQGSIEAIVGALEKLGTDEVKLRVLHTGVGGITTGDVTLAGASGAMIIGFNVVADPTARRLADEQHVDIRLYRVIYDITEDVRRALEEGLAPEVREETLGQAQVRQLFKISRLGTIAGCYVTEGVVQRNAKVRLIRDNVVVEDERTLDSLKRGKDDAREVKSGLECGIKLAGFDDLKEGDVLEFYQRVEVARTL